MDEMNDQLRSILFVVLALLILFTWAHFFKPPIPPPQPPAQIQKMPASPAESETGSQASNQATASPAAIPAVEAKEEKRVIIESDLYRVELSNRGGVVKSWALKKYFDDQKPPQTLDLVNADSSAQLGWPFSLFLDDPELTARANSALFEVTPAQ